MMPASISNWVRLIEGHPVLLAQERGDLFVLDEPQLRPRL